MKNMPLWIISIALQNMTSIRLDGTVSCEFAAVNGHTMPVIYFSEEAWTQHFNIELNGFRIKLDWEDAIVEAEDCPGTSLKVLNLKFPKDRVSARIVFRVNA